MGDAAHSRHNPDADLAQLLLMVGRLLRSRTRSVSETTDLTDTERTVMRIVDLSPGVSPSGIAERTSLQRANVSAALKSLERKGMITRETSTGLGIEVHGTIKAASTLETLRASWAAELHPHLEGLTAEDVRRCVLVLAHLEKRLTTA